jgi:NADH-quinone oxidoreductase subunit J
VHRHLYIALIAGLLPLAWVTAAPAQEADSGAAAGEVLVAIETAQPDPAAISAATEAILFYIVGGVAALSALGCVLSVNIVRMAVCLFGTLGAVAILYFLMAANFLAVIQLIVYAGGTLIVIVFGIMLTSKSPWVRYVPRPVELVIGGAVCLLLFVGLTVALLGAPWDAPHEAAAGYEVAQIGQALLTTYLVPFELVSVLLLAVMIGAAYLATRQRA